MYTVSMNTNWPKNRSGGQRVSKIEMCTLRIAYRPKASRWPLSAVFEASGGGRAICGLFILCFGNPIQCRRSARRKWTVRSPKFRFTWHRSIKLWGVHVKHGKRFRCRIQKTQINLQFVNKTLIVVRLVCWCTRIRISLLMKSSSYVKIVDRGWEGTWVRHNVRKGRWRLEIMGEGWAESGGGGGG